MNNNINLNNLKQKFPKNTKGQRISLPFLNITIVINYCGGPVILKSST